MLSRGQDQLIEDNNIYSIGRDLLIFNVHNSNNTVQRKKISSLSKAALTDETLNVPLIAAGSVSPQDVENIPDLPVASLLSQMEQPHHIEQVSDLLDKPELRKGELGCVPPNKKGKGKARATDHDIEELERNKDCWVYLTSTQDRHFPSVARMTRNTACSETYAFHMLSERYGYPLWLPAPDMSLPAEYREIGTNIGDVGIITPDGGFDFLFNIWLPSSHPINPRNLPPDFDLLYRPHKTTYKEKRLFNSLGYICHGVLNSNTDYDKSSLEFKCVKEEGSVIALPEGASREDLKNEKSLEDFIKQSAESWYRYANGPGDRLIDRDSLYLVTGCMKTTHWGIATHSGAIPSPYNVIVFSKSMTNVSEPYLWTKQGGTTARAGPYLDEDLDNPVSHSNQCLFIRGYKIALSEAAWHALQTPGSLSLAVDMSASFGQPGHEAQSGSCPPPPSDSHGSGPSGSAAGFSESVRRTTNVNLENSTQTVNILHMPTNYQIWHPADALNDLLLKQFPQARVALTHDNTWCDIVDKYGSEALTALPSYVRKLYQPCYANNGAIFSARTREVSETKLFPILSYPGPIDSQPKRKILLPLWEDAPGPFDSLLERETLLPLCKDAGLLNKFRYSDRHSSRSARRYNPYPLPKIGLENRTAEQNIRNNPIVLDALALSGEIHQNKVASIRTVVASKARRTRQALFHCDLCPQAFTTNHNLTNHVNSHMGIKSFTCLRCTKSFGTRSVLARHMKTCKVPEPDSGSS